MRHSFQEAAGAGVCVLLVAVLLNAPAFGQEHHPLPLPAHAPVAAPAKAVAAQPHAVVKPMAVPQPHDLAAMHKDLVDKLRGAFELAAELFSGNHTHLLSDIEAELLSNNKAALLSGNKAKILSEINPNVFSGNKSEILSGNKPEILSGNQMPVFSGNRIEFFSNLKIDIRIENTGNNNGNQPGMPMPSMPGAAGAPTPRPSAVPMHSTPVTRPAPAAGTAPAIPPTPTP